MLLTESLWCVPSPLYFFKSRGFIRFGAWLVGWLAGWFFCCWFVLPKAMDSLWRRGLMTGLPNFFVLSVTLTFPFFLLSLPTSSHLGIPRKKGSISKHPLTKDETVPQTKITFSYHEQTPLTINDHIFDWELLITNPPCPCLQCFLYINLKFMSVPQRWSLGYKSLCLSSLAT